MNPRVVIVTESSNQEVNNEAMAQQKFLEMLKEETTIDVWEHFLAVDVLCLFFTGKMSAQARHRRLKKHLMNSSDQMQINRSNARSLFFAQHFVAFFRYACNHFALTFKEPFNFIKTSRLQFPVSSYLDEHLSAFLSKIWSTEELMEFGIPMIASSFLLDNYPPDMHLFDPADVFQALYQEPCLHVGRSGVLVHENSRSMLLPTGFVRMVKGQLTKWFEAFIQDVHTTSALIHGDNLRRHRARWVHMRSDNTCFVCLQREPQYGLPCRHSVCENCVRVFGERSARDPLVFEVRECFLCGLRTSGMIVKVKASGAGVRVLSIDGGGARGIVPLQFLQLLQDRIGLPYPIQDNFDIAYGTSSGFLIIAALFLNGWSVEDCAVTFESLARVAFKPRGLSHIPILSSIQQFIVSYLVDSLYLARDLETALKRVFGEHRSILDYSHATVTGAKVKLPVTTIPETSSCIFTNYNGVGTRNQDCGYHIIRSPDDSRRIHIWEIARCGSAAPWFFTPKHIPGLGTFQDGGLWRNNPVDIALSEIHAIWPEVEGPELVVSLGTGSSRLWAGPPRTSGPRGIWKDGFIPRLYRVFMSSMSGKRFWQEFRNRVRVDAKGQYFRFDIEFDGTEPSLDDMSNMQELKSKACCALSGSKELDNLAQYMVALLFYFELESIPKREKGQYLCVGNILCLLCSDNPALEALLAQLSRSSARFFLGDRLIPGRIEDRSFTENGNFRKRLEFRVKDLQYKTSICLGEGSSPRRPISGAPFSMEKLCLAQGLSAPFGSADHRKRKRGGAEIRSPEKRRRL